METKSSALSWRWLWQGAVAGALIAVLTFATLLWLRDDPIDPVSSRYAVAEPVPLDSHQLFDLTVRDDRQPSAIPALPALGGERCVSLTAIFDYRDEYAEGVLDLSQLEVAAFAVDSTGDNREELAPTRRGQRTLDGLRGVVEAGDPFWLRVSYESPRITPDHYEIEMRIDGTDHTFIVESDHEERSQ